MSALLDIATGMTRTWVSLYTSGLPPEFRDSRRAEIDSDVWEHQRTADLLNQTQGETSLQLLARLVLGIPSDVTWRLETGRSVSGERSIPMNGALYMRALVAAGVVLALFLILSAYTGVAWYWVLMITIPIGIAMVAIAFFRARQTGWPRGAGTA